MEILQTRFKSQKVFFHFRFLASTRELNQLFWLYIQVLYYKIRNIFIKKYRQID